MSELDGWLRRQAKREQRVVLLEEALLGGRLWRYSSYRLRFFFVRYVVSSAAHAVTVLVLFRALKWESFLLVVLVSAASALAGSFWWGALEGLRARVRDLHRSGRPHRIASAIGGWLALSIALGALVLAVAAGWTAWRAVAEFRAVDAYVAALLVGLALELPVRCYHSGVYALRRVYKPLPAALAPELAGTAVLLALWQPAGAWALVASSVVATAASTALTLRYTHRVYHFLGLRPLAGSRTLPRRVAREALGAGASHAVMALDSLVVLALLYGAARDSEALVVLFLAAPTIRAGVDWARLLYFDLKRLELRLFTNLRRRFERHTLRLAWLLGVIFWLCASAIATAFYARSIGALYLALLAFFLARSLLARAQIQAFAEGAYGAVLATGALCLVGLAAVGPFAGGESERLGAVALVTGVAAVALTRLRGAARARGEPGVALLTLEWLRRLGHVRERVVVASARVVSASAPDRIDTRGREEANRWRLSQLAERTARRVGRTGAAAWIGPDRVVWFEPPGATPRVSADWLQAASGGLVGELVRRDCPAGEEALLAAGQSGMLGDASPHLLAAILPVDVGAARLRFRDLIAGGVVYAPDEPVPAELAALPASELRGILLDASAFARDLRVGRRRSSYDVTALCAGGELRLIFVADPHAGRRARGRWRREVVTLNVRAAIGGVRGEARPLAIAGRAAFLRT